MGQHALQAEARELSHRTPLGADRGQRTSVAESSEIGFGHPGCSGYLVYAQQLFQVFSRDQAVKVILLLETQPFEMPLSPLDELQYRQARTRLSAESSPPRF